MEELTPGNKKGNGILTHSPGICGGQLVRMNNELIEAGVGKHSYILYTCERCGDFVTVGGEGNISTK